MTAERADPAARDRGTVWAVVLAGGAARRFGSDKLAARLDEHTLLEHAISGLPAGARVVLVGPDRALPAIEGRPVTCVREDPPGGGPAAAMIAGLRAVLGGASPPAPDDAIIVLPGDAPAAGEGAAFLLAAFLGFPGALAAVGVDDSGREQPLQLVLRVAAAQRLIATAGPGAGHGASARALVAALGRDLCRVPLPHALHADIDTTADLERWREEQG